MFDLGEILGYLVVLLIIGLLICEAFAQFRKLKSKKANELYINKCYVMFNSLNAVIFFYSVSVLAGLEIIASDYSTVTLIVAIVFFCLYLFSRFTIKHEK